MFFPWVARKIGENDSILCLGLDPALDLEEDVEGFGRRILDAAARFACCVKPNAAFYEARGAAGWTALARTVEHAHAADLPVILDCKRSDIGNTADAYAHAAFVTLGADAVTVNPYLGRDGVIPFSRVPGKGVFVLCRTTNQSALEIQGLECDGEPLYRIVARHAAAWAGDGPAGLVMGATDVQAIREIRRLHPSVWLLIPGIGTQGGSLEAVRVGLSAEGLGVVVSVSRAIAGEPDPAARAARFRDELNRSRRAG